MALSRNSLLLKVTSGMGESQTCSGDAFRARIEANGKAHEWAARCLELRAPGKAARTKAAEVKATNWLRKVLALEERAGGKPRGGRELD